MEKGTRKVADELRELLSFVMRISKHDPLLRKQLLLLLLGKQLLLLRKLGLQFALLVLDAIHFLPIGLTRSEEETGLVGFIFTVLGRLNGSLGLDHLHDGVLAELFVSDDWLIGLGHSDSTTRSRTDGSKCVLGEERALGLSKVFVEYAGLNVRTPVHGIVTVKVGVDDDVTRQVVSVHITGDVRHVHCVI